MTERLTPSERIESESWAHRAERELRATVESQAKELKDLQEFGHLAERLGSARLMAPKWVRDTSGKKGKKAIATLQLSDLHLDEVVKPEQVSGYNAYNRKIAEMRLRLLGENTLTVARDYIAGVEYEGMTILATGDVFSGDIHDELRLTNEDTLFGSTIHWVEQMSAFLKLLVNDLGKLHVAAVVGNHGRNTQKPIYKNRPQQNIEWLFWSILAREFASDERVTFQIADGLSDVVTVYNTRYAIEHGDEFKGGSGISGSMAPLLLGQHRTAVQRLAMGMVVDWLCVGHFHTYQPPALGLIRGGSVVGYSEYAAGKHLRPEIPQQGFWITSPEHGPTISAPILCGDRKSEGW